MAAAESEGQHGVREAEDISRGLAAQRLVGHRQGFGFVSKPWGKWEALKGIKWKSEEASHRDVENGCREPRGEAESTEAAMPLSRQETMVAQTGCWT